MTESSKDPEKDGAKKITIWPQWLTAFTLGLAVIGSGLANGWASPYLAQLTSTEAGMPLRVTDTEASWVASLLSLGRLVGSLLGPLCQVHSIDSLLQHAIRRPARQTMANDIVNREFSKNKAATTQHSLKSVIQNCEYIGRKRVFLLGTVPVIMSWICTICATSVIWLYAARFCSGIGSGMIWSAISMYLSEIADPSIRGSLISMNVSAGFVGMFLGNAMGPYLSMEMFGYVSLVPNILFMILFSLIPESPYYYLLHGDIDKAEASLKWFRREADVKAELREFQEFVDGAETNICLKLKEFCLPNNLKKTFLVIGLYAFAYASGYNALTAYAEIIVARSGVSIEPSLVVTMLGLATIVAGSTATLLVDRFGRRRLLIFSGLGSSIALALLGLHFHLLSLEYDAKSLTWLPVIALLVFNLSLCSGLQPVPGTLLGELFPANLKNVVSLCVHSGNALMSFANAKSYQPYLDLVGEKFVYWTYSICLLFSVPYIYFLIPETKGKSLLEIQRLTNK